MIKINQVIIVEGKYDKIKLSSFIDATIITTDGFNIFKNKNKINIIKKLANNYGIIILTDSDIAGFKIRNYISSFLPSDKIIHIYIPQILGKEKRKLKSSKENLLGVEGINKKIILDCFNKAGISYEENSIKNKNNNKAKINNKKVTKLDLYFDGLIGSENSCIKRDFIKKRLNLPSYISTKSLLDIVNRLLTFEEYKQIINDLNKN